MNTPVLILHASGTNRDHDTAEAVKLAGGHPDIIHLHDLAHNPGQLKNYAMLIVAGGFSYGDALGAGKRLAFAMRDLQDAFAAFVATAKPVLGICNGFQALVQAGLFDSEVNHFHLGPNHRGNFECRWVHLKANDASPCVFTRHLKHTIYCPVAHGEGQLSSRGPIEPSQIALQYCCDDLSLAAGRYPLNPNGSAQDIAGLCNAEGNVLGLMPHPENHIYTWQHPNWRRGAEGQQGLALFTAGIDYAKTL